MSESQKRGQLTERVQAKAKELLGREISQKELRLMPYIQFTLMNSQKIDPNHINGEERELLMQWKKDLWCKAGMTSMEISKMFWDAMSEILFLAYVDIDK